MVSSSQLDLRTEAGCAERRADRQIGSPPVVTNVGERERKAVDIGAIERVEHREGKGLIRGCEIEVGGKPARVTCSELTERRPALEDQSLVEQAELVQPVERVILRGVDQCGIPPAFGPLVSGGRDALR